MHFFNFYLISMRDLRGTEIAERIEMSFAISENAQKTELGVLLGTAPEKSVTGKCARVNRFLDHLRAEIIDLKALDIVAKYLGTNRRYLLFGELEEEGEDRDEVLGMLGSMKGNLEYMVERWEQWERTQGVGIAG